MARQRQPSRFRQFLRGCGCLFKLGFLVTLMLGLTGAVALLMVVKKMEAGLPDVGLLEKFDSAQTSRVLASDGTVVATLFEENRTVEPLDRISPHLIHALVAIEDSRFYQHHGVDWIGVGRAAYANFRYGEVDQGASTLTMQLARARFLTQDRTFRRKLREVLLAQQIEKRFPKSRILELYLNNVYFGAGAYGIGAASSLYFNKRAKDLDVAEAAMLAGLLQAPSSLSPLVNPERAIKRQKLVLSRMQAMGYIKQDEYNKAVAEGERMDFSHEGSGQATSEQLLKYPYFTSYVISELSQRFPADTLYRGGLTIATTMDVGLQRLAEQTLEQTLGELGPGVNADNAALVLIENKTGYVRAMVGGKRWSQRNQFNRAWQAIRQPGSSFKAFVYAAALESGMTPETIVSDKAVSFGGYSPKNSDGRYMGDIPMRVALTFSRNIVSAQLMNKVGANSVIALAHRMGVTEELTDNLSLALGSSEVSPLSMATGYATIASGGLYRYPHVVTLVTDPANQVLTDNRSDQSTRALSEATAAAMTEMLMRVVNEGTGTAAALTGIQVAGKTGTTDESRDAWFVGFTPDYTLAVWVGNDDHSQMWDVFGGGLPATLWHRLMDAVAYATKPRTTFACFDTYEPHRVKICNESKMLASKGCSKTHEEVFRTRYQPEVPCKLHADKEPTETPTPDEVVPEDTPTPEETPLPEELPEPTPDEPLPTDPMQDMHLPPAQPLNPTPIELGPPTPNAVPLP